MSNERDVVGRLRVEYFYDPESKNWGFVVPSLHIVGGSDTRAEAEHEALDAIAFALECYGEDDTPADVGIEGQESFGTEVTYVRVTLQPGDEVSASSDRRAVRLKVDG